MSAENWCFKNESGYVLTHPCPYCMCKLDKWWLQARILGFNRMHKGFVQSFFSCHIAAYCSYVSGCRLLEAGWFTARWFWFLVNRHVLPGYAKWYTATYPSDLASFAANVTDSQDIAKQKSLRRQQQLRTHTAGLLYYIVSLFFSSICGRWC